MWTGISTNMIAYDLKAKVLINSAALTALGRSTHELTNILTQELTDARFKKTQLLTNGDLLTLTCLFHFQMCW